MAPTYRNWRVRGLQTINFPVRKQAFLEAMSALGSLATLWLSVEVSAMEKGFKVLLPTH